MSFVSAWVLLELLIRFSLNMDILVHFSLVSGTCMVNVWSEMQLAPFSGVLHQDFPYFLSREAWWKEARWPDVLATLFRLPVEEGGINELSNTGNHF